MKGICRLCGNEGDLKEGHVIPSFVFKWKKETSGTGFVRTSGIPNKRVQDGPKRYYLCEKCEGLFSAWETEFARTIFYPCNVTGTGVGLIYGSWMLKFTVSVSWRVLNFEIDKTNLSTFPERLKPNVASALSCWKEFLLGNVPHPAQFEQHMFPLGPVKSSSNMELPSNINRYFLRAVDLDVVHGGEKSAFIYSKLGRLVLLGFIEMPHSKRWSPTKVHVRKGVLGKRKYTLPTQLLGYLMDRAKFVQESQESMSLKQRERIAETYERNKERGFHSDTFQALGYDIELFGEEAVFDENKKDSKQ